jgi:hypothetical protein
LALKTQRGLLGVRKKFSLFFEQSVTKSRLDSPSSTTGP